MENKAKAEKLLSLSEHQRASRSSEKITKTLQKIFTDKIDQNQNPLGNNKSKYLTPRAVINKNQMPKLNKPYPKKTDSSIDRVKFTIQNINSDLINKKEESKMANIRGFFSPKIKYRQQILKKHLLYSEDTRIKTNQSEITNINRILDLGQRISLPPININKSHLSEEFITPFSLPKTRKFVTVSFNQIMLKDLYKNKKTKKLLKNLFMYKYLSLNEMNKKLML